MEANTYIELKCNIDCVQSIEEFYLIQKLNEHVEMEMTAIVKEKEKDKFVKSATEKQQVKVKAGDNILFQGMIKNVEMKQEGNLYYMVLKGISNSYKTDVKKKCRSFQDKGMSYYDMVKNIITEYKSGHLIDTASDGKSIKKIQLQYYETDWDYVRRMASHFNEPLIADCKQEGVNLYFGVPAGKNIGKIEQYKYRISKNIAKYMRASQNTNQKIKEKDSITIHIDAEKEYKIGDYGTFDGGKVYVRKKVIRMNKGILRYQYELADRNGLTCSKEFNNKMVGVSMKGKVLERVRDHLKLHLEIDESQDKGTAWLFPYATMYASEGNSGWYCMPEENDTVLVYFPNTESGDAVATGSIRTQGSSGDKIDNPKIKYFRTADGKEVMFSPDEIIITCKDNEILITLNQSDGITISSTENIKIHSDKEVTIEAEEEISINAKEKIDMRCKSSKIIMDGDIEIYGEDVRIN